tara:strand:- start:101 stop:838 length:738 start_codon:yes stop_codon:yes gene_type:complete
MTFNIIKIRLLPLLIFSSLIIGCSGEDNNKANNYNSIKKQINNLHCEIQQYERLNKESILKFNLIIDTLNEFSSIIQDINTNNQELELNYSKFDNSFEDIQNQFYEMIKLKAPNPNKYELYQEIDTIFLTKGLKNDKFKNLKPLISIAYKTVKSIDKSINTNCYPYDDWLSTILRMEFNYNHRENHPSESFSKLFTKSENNLETIVNILTIKKNILKTKYLMYVNHKNTCGLIHSIKLNPKYFKN